MYAALDFAFAIGPSTPSSRSRRADLRDAACASSRSNLLGAFVLRLRRLDRHFHDLIAALVGARVQHALLAQPELLAVLGALRNLQQRAAVDGRHFDLGAQRRFRHRDRHLDFDIVAVAAEERMLFHRVVM